MRHRRERSCFAVASFAAFLLISIHAVAAPPAGYYLVWDSEFNGASLDTTKWGYRLQGSYRDAYNTPNAVSFNGSNLVITTYTSGGTNFSCMLYAEKKFESKYGYWESSLSWSDSPGEWSGFWMLAPNYSNSTTQDKAAPDINDPPTWGEEIDICEHRCTDGTDVDNLSPYIQVNLHWELDPSGTVEEISDPGSPLVPTAGGLQTGFHTYGFLWTSNAYSFLIDNTQVYSNLTTTPVMHSAEYPLLTSAVDDTSTTWAGYIPSGGYGSQTTSTTKLSVAYVRYYARTNVLFWTGASSAYWNNSANWISNLPPSAGSDLTFSYLSTANRSMKMGQNYTVDGLIFLNSGGAFSVSDANTLTLGAGGIDMVAANDNVSLSLPLNLAANQTWAIGPNDPNGNLTLTVNGNISGSATLTKASYGTLLLGGTNSFSGTLNVDSGGTNINDGKVILASPAAVSNASLISIRDTGASLSALQLSNGVAIPCAVSLAGRTTNGPAIEGLSGSNTLAGGLTLVGGGSLYLLQSDAGSINLGGTITAGTTATGARVLTLQGPGNFAISGSIQNGSATSVGLVKTNGGTLTLEGTNPCTGTLAVWGGTLAGTGSFAGPATIESGATLLPGGSNAVGTLAFGGNLTLAAGTLTQIGIRAAPLTNAQVRVAGALTRGGTLLVTNFAGTLAPGESFQLFQAAASSGDFAAVTLPPLNAGLFWNTNSLTNGVITVAAAPEMLTVTNGSGDGLQLQWVYGTLQSASNVAGPYSVVSNAVSPYTIPLTNAQQFYRIRED